MSQSLNIGIIGGGVTGLAAAYRFLKSGHRATVFEAGPQLGGQASTFDLFGGRLERAYHHLFRSDRAILDLMEEIGLGDRMEWIDSKVGFFRRGQIYDFVTPVDLLRFTPLPLVDRIRLGLVGLYLQRYRDWKKLEPYTAENWIRHYAGRRNYEIVWEPLLRGKFGVRAPEVGMVWFWGKIHVRFASRGKGMTKEQLGYPRGSFGEIFDVLGERIREVGGIIHQRTPVKRVVFEDGRAVGIAWPEGDGERIDRFDAILATVPSPIFLRLVPELPDSYANLLKGVQYQAAVLLVLGLRRPLSRIYWLNISDRDIPFVGVIEQTNLVDKSRYGGNYVVYCSNYLAKDDRIYSLNRDELIEEYLPHIQKINPEFDRDWIVEAWRFHEDGAQPIIGTYYSKQIPEYHTGIPGLYLANTTQIYPEDRGTNYSVRLANDVVSVITRDFATE